ncbi:MAG: VanZ family protein [Armatimonadota bacterium]
MGLDKVAHLLLYGVLAALFVRASADLRQPREHGRRVAVLCIARSFFFCALFGAVDEWHQQFFGRSTSVADWLADLVGILIGSAGMMWYVSLRFWRSENGGGTTDQR